ncbi:MAG TPA: zinc ABC transporter substrate-binding protein, partial [Ilumatobacteraceae bacterium]|nr:zinc ABC transporter substrate-binding protein [Ilumatobacteraceae bacterium]
NIVSKPDADPHDYEPTADDARTISTAEYVIFNGAGYDEWARNVVDSNADKSQSVLDIGALVGATAGDNPHRWYFPGDVRKVVDRLVDDYKRLDPTNAAAFDRNKADFESTQFTRYTDMLDSIRQKHTGVPVGASESLFEGVADATGLDLATPTSFITAISEGIDPTVQDKASLEQQIATKAIKVFVFNPQNSTSDIANLVKQAQRDDVPVVEFTETLVGATFIDWQVAQLQRLADALGP